MDEYLLEDVRREEPLGDGRGAQRVTEGRKDVRSAALSPPVSKPETIHIYL